MLPADDMHGNGIREEDHIADYAQNLEMVEGHMTEGYRI